MGSPIRIKRCSFPIGCLTATILWHLLLFCNLEGLGAICSTNFDWSSKPEISHSHGDLAPLRSPVLLAAKRMYLSNGMSFLPWLIQGVRVCAAVTCFQQRRHIVISHGQYCYKRLCHKLILLEQKYCKVHTAHVTEHHLTQTQ